MAESLDYIYDHFIPEEGAFAVRLFDDGVKATTKAVVKHVTGDSIVTKEKKKKSAGPSMSKSAISIKERMKDPEDRRREN